MIYQLYLLGKARQIHAIEYFGAEDDVRAVGIAESAFSLISGDFDGYEVWNGTTIIADNRSRLHPSRWWAITQASQRDVLDLAARVQRTSASASKSQPLLEKSGKS